LVQGRTAFERAAPPDQAMLAYQAALQRWPGNLTLGLGLGNATQATGDTAGAAVVFERLARQQGSAVAWNNLAMARLKLGDGASALQAARQAVQRAQSAEPAWLSAAQATLADVLKAVSTPISTTP
jgi:tetratricopeptide (TPR) repeat protein